MAGPWWERKDRWRKDEETDRENGLLAGAAWSRMLLGARGARRRDVNRRSARRDGFPAVAFDAPEP